MIGIPWFFVIAFVVMLILLSIASKNRRQMNSPNARQCRACGATHPEVAQFCRRCGQRL